MTPEPIDVPDRLRPALARLAAGEAPANVGLMHLLIEAVSPDEVEGALTAALAGPPSRDLGHLREALALLRAHPDAFRTVKAVMAEARHDRAAETPEAALRHWSKTFDRLAELAPDGGSALYGLGSPALLARATDEIVRALCDWGLVGPDRDVLEIGCGSGRIVRALAPIVRRVTGTDISDGMITEARRRCAGLADVHLIRSAGRDLSGVPDDGFDLVLAVDVFPYLVQAGGNLARRHVEEAARVLRPGGGLLILNYSYGGDPAADVLEVSDLFRRSRLKGERAGTRDLAHWDGVTFLARKPPAL